MGIKKIKQSKMTTLITGNEDVKPDILTLHWIASYLAKTMPADRHYEERSNPEKEPPLPPCLLFYNLKKTV